jgi:hypothetical protein
VILLHKLPIMQNFSTAFILKVHTRFGSTITHEKVKLSICLIKYHILKAYGEVEV